VYGGQLACSSDGGAARGDPQGGVQISGCDGGLDPAARGFELTRSACIGAAGHLRLPPRDRMCLCIGEQGPCVGDALIYCLSGTGNSLGIARLIAERLGGKTIPIASMIDRERPEPDVSVISITLPVYYADAANIVRRFAEKPGSMEGKYISAVSTCGGGRRRLAQDRSRSGADLDSQGPARRTLLLASPLRVEHKGMPSATQ